MGQNKKSQKKAITKRSKRINLDHFTVRTFQIVFFGVFVAICIILIGFARGMRFDFSKKTLSSTGILAISSSPKNSKIYINNEFKGVTDLNITLPPGTYKVDIVKDGYISYSKTLSLKGELVETVDPILFPINPSLTPVTNLGITKAVRVEGSDRLLLFSQNNNEEKDGVYLFDSANKAISLFPPLKPLLLKKKLPPATDFENVTVTFSYDSTQAILDFPQKDKTVVSYLLSLDTENQDPFDISDSKQNLMTAWQAQRDADRRKLIEAFPREIRKIASDSFSLVSSSADKTKILYRATASTAIPLVINPPLIAANQTPESRSIEVGNYYVYDKLEDKNYYIGDRKMDITHLAWYSDSKRLIYYEDNLISVFLYDGSSKQTVYSGPIQKGFFMVNTDGQIMILANLNPLTNKLPDIYQVGIR